MNNLGHIFLLYLVFCIIEQFPAGGGTAIYGHIGMCRCEGYGIQAVYSSIGYINQSIWV